MNAPVLRVLIADDDPRARERIRHLASEAGGVSIVAECADGAAAVDALRAHDVDAVFLDVDMPKLDGFGVIATIGADQMPPIVFVSAFSEFAVRAFEAYAVDYILKPYDDGRFAMAIDRLRALQERPEPADPRIEALVADASARARRSFPEAIAVKAGARYIVLRFAEIEWIEADGNYAKLHAAGRTHVITKSLAKLEGEILDPAAFIRVHKSAIVNVRTVVSLEPIDHGDMTLVVKGGQRVPCSRRYRERLEQKLALTS